MQSPFSHNMDSSTEKSLENRSGPFNNGSATISLGAFTSKPIPLQLMWILLFIATVGGCAYHISNNVTNYLQYTKVVNVDLVPNSVINFPQVLICHPLWFKAAKDSLVDANSQLRYRQQIFETNVATFWSLIRRHRMKLADNATLDRTTKDLILDDMKQSYMPYMAKTSALLGPEDTIFACIFSDNKCDSTNFTIVMDSKKGVCFQSEFNTNFVTAFGSGAVGPGSGLYILFNSWNYVGLGNPGHNSSMDLTGIKLYIKKSTSFLPNTIEPKLAQRGATFMFGFQTNEYIQLSTPNDPCQPTKLVKRGQLSRGGSILWSYVEEDQEVCTQSVNQQNLIAKCGCFSYDWLLLPNIDFNKTPFCLSLPHDVFETKSQMSLTQNGSILILTAQDSNSTSTKAVNLETVLTKYKCQETFKKSLEMGPNIARSCQSSQLCSKTSYTDMTDQYIYNVPSAQTGPTVMLSIGEQSTTANKAGYTNDTYSALMKNPRMINQILAYYSGVVEVFPFALDDVQSVEALSYTVVQLLSDLGGIIGLWVGLSLVSLLEFMEAIYMMTRIRSSSK